MAVSADASALAFLTICPAYCLNSGRSVFAKRHRLGGDNMHERPALTAGKDAAIDRLIQFFIVGENHSAAGAAEGLMRRGGDNMRMRERRRMNSRRHKAGDVRDVRHEQRADFIGDLPELGEIDRSGIALYPQRIIFGFSSSALARTLPKSIVSVFGSSS